MYLSMLPHPHHALGFLNWRTARQSEGSDGTITLNQSRKAWAAELDPTHEALCRALSRLHSEDRLTIQGQQLRLGRDPSRKAGRQAAGDRDKQ